MPTTAVLPTILLVDDDLVTRALLRWQLQGLPLHAHVLEAENGARALDLVQAHCQASAEPLLVLLDLNMPVMDGLAFLEQQAHLPASCRARTTVVVVSATVNQAARAKASRLAREVRPKPLSTPQLTALVRQHLPTALTA